MLHDTVGAGDGEAAETRVIAQMIRFNEPVQGLLRHAADDEFFASAKEADEGHDHELRRPQVDLQLEGERGVVGQVHLAGVVPDQFDTGNDFSCHVFKPPCCADFRQQVTLLYGVGNELRAF